MKLPEYVTADEVKRVCDEIGLRDWFRITDENVSNEEASRILNIVNTEGMDIPIETFGSITFCVGKYTLVIGKRL
ncbi:MAG TPA: hypothetical protein ENN40_04880 [Candidatus Aminicenantes bacterium]|nr:hypothetical protein [Candidatus Aminicenantes bacterium]